MRIYKNKRNKYNNNGNVIDKKYTIAVASTSYVGLSIVTLLTQYEL